MLEAAKRNEQSVKNATPPGKGGEAADRTTAIVSTLRPEFITAAAENPDTLHDTLTFLRAVYGAEAPGWLPVFLLPARITHWLRADDLTRAADIAIRAAARRQNAYVPVALQQERLKSGRGSADTACALTGLWADIDVQGPAHTSTGLPPDEAAALALLAEFPLAPTAIVHSGHGLQGWWLFRELWTFDSDAERHTATELARHWQVTLQAVAARHGWRIDDTSDLARVLRLPGTINWKQADAPAPVRLLSLEDSRRYNPSEFDPYLLFDTEDHSSHRQAEPAGEVIPEGRRNQTLISLAGTMRRRGMSEAAILAALQAENADRCQPPLAEQEVRRIVASVSRYAPAAAADAASPEHLSDWGNARRLVRLHGEDLRYCHPWRRWLVWDGRRWVIDDTAEVERRAKQTVASIYAEAAGCPDEEQRKALAKHAMRSEAATKLAAMMALAQSEPGIPVLPDDLDTNPWALNTVSGTIKGQNMMLHEHSREDLITRLAPVAYAPAAQCPTWLAFLDRIMDGNRELIGFLQRAVGYSLTGDTSERCMFILWGTGKNGKTTFVETIAAMLGDYAVRTPTETLLVKRGDSIPNDVARLKGARFVFASESEEGRRLAESQIKAMTGRDTLVARYLRAEFFEFKPEFKLWLDTNHKPVIRGTDNAIWDRIMLVPFQVRIPEAEQDKRLSEKLLVELPGILAWAIQGCLAWQHHGLQPPTEVQAATAEYRKESDVLHEFLDECCIEADELSVRAKSLLEAYRNWCEKNGEKPMSSKALSERLAERGFTRRRERVGTVYYGLGVHTDEQDEF